eukprot:TRINITY_DN33662_c1_g1_i2.p1 TRINITY_DN33662_c1_g1~~TRINITY_DN33662_c1_g1_i2.p1  ORF type:complete len:146 (-),score=20.62 TRINITY_DN33662_c1_g1_i2:244-648(-)
METIAEDLKKVIIIGKEKTTNLLQEIFKQSKLENGWDISTLNFYKDTTEEGSDMLLELISGIEAMAGLIYLRNGKILQYDRLVIVTDPHPDLKEIEQAFETGWRKVYWFQSLSKMPKKNKPLNFDKKNNSKYHK